MSGIAGKTYAIHPAVGIARVGNAEASLTDPSSYYLGAESPNQVPNEGLDYKIKGKIKKQAQRFRIYEFQDGQATREITLQEEDVAAIEWTVHLKNRKAALDSAGIQGTPSRPAVLPPKPWGLDAPPAPGDDPDYWHYWPAATRNRTVPGDQRGELCIDAGSQSVDGDTTEQDLWGTITFRFDNQPRPKRVNLGKLCTEAGTGRLLVFAGSGSSEGLNEKGQYSQFPKLESWGNNDQWYDDTADGPVQATITFRDGGKVTLVQPEQRAWVISSAPRFSPAMDWITTLYDVALSVVSPPTGDIPNPSFAQDIYPILRCASQLPWLSVRASWHANKGNYQAWDRLRLLSDNNPSVDSDPYKARNGLFSRIRNPNEEPIDRENVQKEMPQVSGDITRNKEGDYDVAVVTPLQYAQLQKWRDGEFEADGVPTYVPLDEVDIASQPSAIDRAAVEGTAGTPFYPGIESWRILRTPELYAGSCPLRLSDETQPGDLTMGNALPWQADFLDCNDIWWPVQRPNEVTRDGKPLQPWVPISWMPTQEEADYNKMVEDWWKLGFVVPVDDGTRYEEVEGSTEEEPSA